VAATRAEKIKLFEESIAMRRIPGDLRGIAESLTVYAKDVMGICQFVRAEEMLKEALLLFQEIAQQHGMMESQRLLGVNYLLQGKIQRAQVVHQKLLSMHNDLESTISRAYICWTAGYADLHMGDYDRACSQAQESLTLCQNKRLWAYILGSAQAKSILGRAAFARRDYAAAQRWFEESYSSFQKLFEDHRLQNVGEENNFGQALACLGYVERRLNQIAQAQRHFLEALRLGMQHEHFLPLIHVLPGIALLFADQGEVEQSVELYALASTLDMVANSKWFADIAGDEIAQMAEQLPVEVVETAKARGRELDLWETAKALLVELKELGWGDADQQVDPAEPPAMGVRQDP
jgi:tetratricopeptide (TPR) repeat protein